MSIIQFKKVTKQFSDGTVAFSNLSFDVEPGEKVIFTGPSGSGKTTVMRLLIREYVPTKGEIDFEDNQINKLKRHQLPAHRRKIGVVFQDYKLVEELNVWENVALPLLIRGEKQNIIEERVTDLLKLVELTNKALMFPRQLSGGESQRIGIARALANSPRVIFADEPTGNLDQETGKHIIRLLTKINQLGTTLLLATHDPLVIDEIEAKVIDLSDFLQKKDEGDDQESESSEKSLDKLVSKKDRKQKPKDEDKDKELDVKNKKDSKQEKDVTNKEASESEAESASFDKDLPKNKKNKKDDKKSSRIGSFFSRLTSSKSSKRKNKDKNQSPYSKIKQPSVEDLLSKESEE